MSPCECNHSSRRSLPQIPERYGPQLERTLCLGSSGKLIWSGVPYQRAYIPVFRVYMLFLYIMKLVFEFMACLCLFAMRLGSKVERLMLIIVPFERLTCVFLRYLSTNYPPCCMRLESAQVAATLSLYRRPNGFVCILRAWLLNRSLIVCVRDPGGYVGS